MPSALTVEAIRSNRNLPEILANDQGEQSSVDAPAIKQIPVSARTLEVAYPEELREEGEDTTFFASCPVPRNWWTEDWDKTWEQYHTKAF